MCIYNNGVTSPVTLRIWIDGGCLYRTSLDPKAGGVQIQVQVPIQVFTLREMEMATNKFNESNVIEKGSTGIVYRGKLRNGTVVAIKMLRANGRSGERAFRLEVSSITFLCYKFILPPFHNNFVLK